MDKIDFKNLSNDEINIELNKLENKYESIKLKIVKMVEEMKVLDSLFIEGKKELINRNKGIFNG